MTIRMQWTDGKIRCHWVSPTNTTYLRYHDEEWGRPVHDDQLLFEMLILENFQAGLTWECVLNKREAFRRAFAGFDLRKVASYSEEKLTALQADSGIIRNRLKIRAAVVNAQAFPGGVRGMKFVGTVIIYAYLQAVGVINSHESGCFLNPLQQ